MLNEEREKSKARCAKVPISILRSIKKSRIAAGPAFQLLAVLQANEKLMLVN
jgi:hypothetical protein